MPKRKVMRKRTDCSKCKLKRICDKNRHNRKGHCQHFIQCIALGQFIKNIVGIDVEEKLTWIPVSEHLPKGDGLYLTTIKTDGEDKSPYLNGLVWCNRWNEATMRWGYANSGMSAWMQSPKHHEGDKE